MTGCCLYKGHAHARTTHTRALVNLSQKLPISAQFQEKKQVVNYSADVEDTMQEREKYGEDLKHQVSMVQLIDEIQALMQSAKNASFRKV